MTHIFILNPTAGKLDRVQKTLFELQVLSQKRQEDLEFYVTEYPGHATELAKAAAEQYNPVRIYACGGDGTINEVLQGLVGYNHVEFGCVPIGSGNDFIKNFEKDDFLNLEQQLTAPSYPVDLIETSGNFGSRYSINVVSLSWDSRVAIEVEAFKKIPLIKGSFAYALSVITQLIKKKTTYVSVMVDGEEFPTKEYLIGMCANGSYYGGGFQGAPFAKLDDGLFELIMVESIPRRAVPRLFPIYQKGKHLTEQRKEFDHIMTYRQGRHLRMQSHRDDIPVTIDGEGFYTPWLECCMVEQAVRLIVPGASGQGMFVVPFNSEQENH